MNIYDNKNSFLVMHFIKLAFPNISTVFIGDVAVIETKDWKSTSPNKLIELNIDY